MDFQDIFSHLDTDTIYLNRIKTKFPKIKEYYYTLYSEREDVDEQFTKLLEMTLQSYNERKADLRELDQKRIGDPRWFQSQEIVGMMLYVDLFNEDLSGLLDKIDYFVELGITYLHLQPLFRMPEKDNDGGYAVSSYYHVDERLGTMDQLEEVSDRLREHGISLCLDFVLNHTSNEHTWALKALAGEKEFQEMYFMFDTKDWAEKYADNTPEVFPRSAPGHFTYIDDIQKYVMTSFFNFQWDLNYKNPKVLFKITQALLFLANIGADIFRLDAIPYIWKELGTTSRNLPEVHIIVRLLRQIMEVVAPGVLFKGEAIVAPRDILPYFGGKGEDECHIMYNASFMVLLWNTLATKDVNLMRLSLDKFPEIPDNTIWLNYARVHDDIGWGFDQETLRELGLDPFLHKQFIINFYDGNYDYSFARGELYEFNHGNLDARTSGTLASLAGIERALDENDEYQLELAIKRILLLHSMIISYPGIPLLYSGDEIAQLNDYNYKTDPLKKNDSRWLHRPVFEWAKAEHRDDLGTLEGKVFQRIKRMIATRKSMEIFSSYHKLINFDTGSKEVFGFFKRSREDNLIVLHNFSSEPIRIKTDYVKQGYIGGKLTDLLQGKQVDLTKDYILIGPYEFLWLYRKAR